MTPTHPKAEHPLKHFKKIPSCTLRRADRTYLTALNLEASLMQCREYIRGSLLDVGCGRKPYQNTYFSGATTYLGADYLSDRSTPDVICSALDLPFDPQSFDTVVSTEVLEHVPDPLLAFKEMHRVLRPTGYLILSTPMYWPRHDLPYDFFRYPYDGLMHLLKESGFEVVRLFNRGQSYAFLGQVIQHIGIHYVLPAPIARAVSWCLNSFFLWCERHLDHDLLTMGWTVVARPVAS